MAMCPSDRFGLAQEKLGNYDGARSMLLKAKSFLPKDSSIAKALVAVSSDVKLHFLLKLLTEKVHAYPHS